MSKLKIRFGYLTIVLVTLIFLLIGSIIPVYISPNQSATFPNSISQVAATETAEIWDSNAQRFNKNVVNDIKNKLFGNQSPKNYIESNYDSQEYSWTQSKVVNARTINSKVGDDYYGMLVTLGGKKWIVTSLTLGDGDKKDDVILTLYLASSEGTSDFEKAATSVKGNNAYCKSALRNDLLTNSNWSLFNSTNQNDFATQFLVQPKFIKYQHTQSSFLRGGIHNTVHVPNEALDEFKSNWHENLNGGYNSISETFNGIRYDAWGDDYIWVPSMTETGAGNNLDTASVWKLTTNQRMPMAGGAQITSWFRTGDSNNYAFANALEKNGDRMYYTTDNKLGVRPAIHLNFTSVLSSINYLNDPQDLETTYNEKGQTLKSIADTTKASWYDKDIYENANNYVDITYPNSLTELKDTGEYWVKAQITQNFINAVYSQVDSEGAANGWTADYIAEIKEKRKPRFIGTADTSDADHLESDTVRWIKIKINEAEVDFSKVKWSADELEYNALNQTVTISEGLPSFVQVKYSDNTKKAVGTYTAQVIELTCTDKNYKVPTTATEIAKYPTLKHTFEITKKKISANWKMESSTQDGVTIAKPVLDVDNSLKNSIEYTYYKDLNMTDPISLDEIFEEFDITEVKTYYVKATLKTTGDFNNSNCIFDNGGGESTELSSTMQTGSTSNSVTIELLNKKVTFNGNSQTASFSVSGGGLTEDALVLKYYALDGTLLTTLPTNAGKYKVKVSLKQDLTDFIIIGTTEFIFEIESLKVTKPRASQTQYFNADGFSISDIANLPKDWKNYFEVKAYDKDNNEILPQNDSLNFVNANLYRIEINFKNGTNTNNGSATDNVIWSDGTKDTFVVDLEIKPLEFIVQGWSESTGNKKPTIVGEDTTEIAKYFDYVIYELKNGIIVGNVLPQNATLKYNTDYQIALKVKDEFKGNVLLDYNGEKIDETESFKFKTGINPNPGIDSDDNDGDDNEGNGGSSGGNNGNGTNSGTDLWFGTNGKMPIFAWILVGIVLLLFIVLILVLILKRDKQQPPPQQPIPYADYYAQKKEETNTDNKVVKDEEPARNVRGTIVNNYKVGYKDWTFVIKETDVLNLEALESPQDEVMFYVFNKNDLRKVKKLQNQIDLANNETNLNSKDDMSTLDKKSNKKRKDKK